MCSFDGLGAFSTRFDDPATASRPFDSSRDGLVPSGGASALVLERYDLAKERKASILGEILAYSFSSDGAHISVPLPGGLIRSMKKGLESAGLKPSDIDYICAHATSTPAGDLAEAESISEVFGPHGPLVSSLKSMTGHELWMSGSSQVVYSTIMARNGFIAPNINFETPDESSKNLTIAVEAVNKSPDHIL